MSNASVVVHSKNEMGTETIVASKSRGVYQSVKPPTSGQTAQMGQQIFFSLTESPQDGNQAILRDIKLKYRFANSAVAPATDSFRIPVSGIWAFIQGCIVKINGERVIELDRRRLKDRYMFMVTEYEDVNQFLNDRIGTVNQTSISTLTGTRTLGVSSSTPVYSSSLKEVFGSLFRNRHLSFMPKIELEFQLIDVQNDYNNTKQLGYSAGSNLSNLSITNIVAVCEYVVYPKEVALLEQPREAHIALPWYDYRDYAVTSQGVGTVEVNLNIDFPLRSVVSGLRFWFTNSALGTTYTTLNNHTVYLNSFVTSIEVQRSGVRIWLWDGAEVYKEMQDFNKRRGIATRDSVYSSSDLASAAPANFLSLERDYLDMPTHGTTHKIKKVSGVSNTERDSWRIIISYDLSSADVLINTLRVAMESSHIICMYSDPSRPAQIFK